MTLPETALTLVSCHINCKTASTYLTHYCVVRADIPIGAQAANLIHAAGQSSPGNLGDGTYAVALTVPDEAALRKLGGILQAAGLPHHTAIESDAPYTGQAMAIGIFPCDRKILKPYLSQLPLLKAPVAQSGRASGVMIQKDVGSNPTGRANWFRRLLRT